MGGERSPAPYRLEVRRTGCGAAVSGIRYCSGWMAFELEDRSAPATRYQKPVWTDLIRIGNA
jgi:hypothetical protein